MELDPFCLNGNEYRIYSIYYDTVNHDIIRENSAGKLYKEKMRIRSYYDKKDPEDTVFMEIKKKSNGVGNKRRIKIKIKEIEPFVNDGVLPDTGDDYLSTQVAKELQYFLKTNKVAPALYVQYDRLALFGKEDKNFRMTFDRNIHIRRNIFAETISFSAKVTRISFFCRMIHTLWRLKFSVQCRCGLQGCCLRMNFTAVAFQSTALSTERTHSSAISIIFSPTVTEKRSILIILKINKTEDCFNGRFFIQPYKR